MKNIFNLFIYLLLLLSFSCKKEKGGLEQYAIPSGLQKISSGYATGAATRVEVYANAALFVGYNKLYIALYDSATNQRVTQGQVSLNIQMNAGSVSGMSGSMAPIISLSGPVENPPAGMADSGLFNAAAIFVKPSGSSSAWILTTQVTNLVNGKSGVFTAPVNVGQPSTPKAYSVITVDDSTNLFVSLVQPENCQFGANPFELSIYKQVNNLSFTPDADYSVQINPIMPAMLDMTSPNNVNPVYSGNGHYLGQVNFTMSGAWQINISLLHKGIVSDSTHYFDINFQ